MHCIYYGLNGCLSERTGNPLNDCLNVQITESMAVCTDSVAVCLNVYTYHRLSGCLPKCIYLSQTE